MFWCCFLSLDRVLVLCSLTRSLVRVVFCCIVSLSPSVQSLESVKSVGGWGALQKCCILRKSLLSEFKAATKSYSVVEIDKPIDVRLAGEVQVSVTVSSCLLFLIVSRACEFPCLVFSSCSCSCSSASSSPIFFLFLFFSSSSSLLLLHLLLLFFLFSSSASLLRHHNRVTDQSSLYHLQLCCFTP